MAKKIYFDGAIDTKLEASLRLQLKRKGFEVLGSYACPSKTLLLIIARGILRLPEAQENVWVMHWKRSIPIELVFGLPEDRRVYSFVVTYIPENTSSVYWIRNKNFILSKFTGVQLRLDEPVTFVHNRLLVAEQECFNVEKIFVTRRIVNFEGEHCVVLKYQENVQSVTKTLWTKDN